MLPSPRVKPEVSRAEALVVLTLPISAPSGSPGASPSELSTAGATWMGVGQSTNPDPGHAGREAASEALAEHSTPKVVVVLASSSYGATEGTTSDNRLGLLLAAVNDTVGEIYARRSHRSVEPIVVGCTTAGEIGPLGGQVGSVVVAAIGGDGLLARARLATDASRDLRAATERAAACQADLCDATHPFEVLLLLTDGLAGDQQEVIRGAYRTVGPGVALVGGCAGDDLRMERTHQFLGRDVHTDAIVAVAIASTTPLGIGVRHGWRKVGEPMLVTRSIGGCVLSLDDRPALDVYLERLAIDRDLPERVADSAAFARLAMTHPLGLERRSGEEVRFLTGADPEQRSITSIAAVPSGSMVWIMEGDAASVTRAAGEACTAAITELGGRRPTGLLAFDCVARAAVLHDRLDDEVDQMTQVGQGAPVAGFYTYGEIARTTGMTGFHNQTLVVLALS